MSEPQDFLVEIGTEELPPKALRRLMDAFAGNLEAAVDAARLEHGPTHAYASPRRLAVLIEALAAGQADRRIAQKGPPVSVAFDDAGNLTAAGAAFATKCGVEITALGRTKSAKGEWLSCDMLEQGQSAAALLPELVEKALAGLPIPRRMRWGDGDAEFVRPVHWIVMLHGRCVIDATIMGIAAGNVSRGHRFQSAGPLTISAPSHYLHELEQQGHVIADFERRRDMVQSGVEAEATRAGGHIVDGESLYDEVASLVEWPVPVTGSFDREFLRLPREVVISTLTGHQRYFPVADDNGNLLPQFITVANIESKAPDQVRDGNERVIRPRLADAAFFWDNDRRTPLAARQDALREVVYQRGLGSLADKSDRVGAIAGWLAAELGVDADNAVRAAALSKCDLLTGMVVEFPDLQGTMGRYYAAIDGEPGAVATAIDEQYMPRHAGDALPASADGQLLAIAERLDTLAGIFTIGKKPSGNRDPFGLRRAALGIVRILVECGLDLDLRAMIGVAVDAQPAGKTAKDAVSEALYTFISDRLRRYFLDRDTDLATETFDAVLARHPRSLVDFERRLGAVQAFIELESASSLAAANKRIGNILKQADEVGDAPVKEKLLRDAAEIELWSALNDARTRVAPLLEARDYTLALSELAELRAPVDRFFDAVMVMVDDGPIRNNRLALLRELRASFLDVADISRLAIA
ncbi:MAG: glycine--tRNA ligase subunit beta [Gammaproteobacteria bacterium]|nr:glycine--tRNA ligase subunit beta [Gammaproteobacteria bacterium]